MKTYLNTISLLLLASLVHAQNTIHIAAGTSVVGAGAIKVTSGSGNFVNNGYYNDGSGTFLDLGGLSFSGSGTSNFYNFTVNHAGTTTLNSLVSVVNNTTLAAGTLAAGSGNLFVRSDLNSLANLSVTGILTGTAQGLITFATAASGSCPLPSTLYTNVTGPATMYQWQTSTDGTGWTNVAGATNATHNTVATTTSWYRCAITTNNSAFTGATAGARLLVTGGATVTTSGNVSICSGTSTVLTAGGAATYSWNPATGLSATTGMSVSATPTTTTTYTVTGTDIGGCMNTAMVTVSVNAGPGIISGDGGGGIITTLYGNGTAGHAGDNGPATSSAVSLRYPRRMAYDANGNLYIGDQASIRKVAVDGTITTIVGSGTTGYNGGGIPATNATVNNVMSIAFDAEGNLYFNDVNNFRIRRIDATTKVITTYAGGDLAVPLYLPDGSLATATGISSTSIAFDAAGDLHYLDYHNNIIRKINHTTNVITTIAGIPGSTGYSGDNGPALNAQFNAIDGDIMFHPNGDLYIADTRNNRVRKIDHTTNIITTVAGNGFGANTFVENFSGDGGPATDAKLSVPQGITFDASGNMYIVDGSNRRVRIVNPSGIINTFAGNGINAFSGDGGSATAASITTPAGVIVDAAGNVLFTDLFAQKVRKVSAQAASVSLCTGSSAILNIGTTGGTWSSSNSNATVNAVSGMVTGVISGTTTISYTLPSGCASTTIVTVNATPTITSDPGTTICEGTATALNAFGGITYTWQPAASLSASTGSSVSASPVATTTYSVTGANATCKQTTTVTVTVVPAPATVAGPNTAICAGTSAALTASGATSYSWTPATGLSSTTGASVTASPTSTTTYSVLGTTGSCSNIATVTVTVNSMPTVSAGSNIAICAGESTVLTASGASSYSWSPASGLSSTAGTAVTAMPLTTTTYTVTGTTGICSSTATVTVTVNPIASPGTISGPASVCVGVTANYFASGTPGGSWSSSNTAVGTFFATGILAGISAGTTIVSYTVTNGCGTVAATFTMTVSALPSSPGPISGPSGVCVGTTIALSSSGSGTWTSSNTARATINSSGMLTGLASGIVNVSYVSSNSCGSSLSMAAISVDPLPSTFGGTLFVCPGAITILTNTPGGGAWSSPDATVSVNATNGKITGITPGPALISYTLPTGCYATTTVTVTPPPGAIGGTMSLCPGSTTLLTNGATGGSWSSSSVARATIDAVSGEVAAISPGITYITYTLSAGCYNTGILTVNAAPMDITGALTLCPGNSITLTSGTSGGAWASSTPGIATINSTTGVVTSLGSTGTSTISYTVGSLCPRTAVVTVAAPTANIGTPAVCMGQPTSINILSNATPGGTWISSNPARVLVSSSTGYLRGLSIGTAIVTYMLDPGCFSTSIVTVNAAVGTITGATSVCPGATTVLTNTTAGGIWVVENTSIATVGIAGAITGINEGLTTVSYMVNPGCYKTVNFNVYGAMSDITGADQICAGSATTLSSGPTGGTWSSSNTPKGTVNITTGQVTGIAAGTTTITYRLGSSGCYVTRVVTINPSLAAIAGMAGICPGFVAHLANSSPGGAWSSSNTDIASVNGTGDVTGINTGTSIITYMTNPACYITSIQTVKSAPIPIAGAPVVCQNATNNLICAPAGGVWSSSNTANATISTAGVIRGIAPGVTTVRYLLSSGCQVTQDVTVNSLPDAITGVTSVCVYATSNLISAPAGGTWTSSNEVKASIDATSGVLAGNSAGTSNITYTLPSGCYTKTIATTKAPPAAIWGTTSIVQGGASILYCSPGGGSWSSADPGIASYNPATGGRTYGAGTGTVTVSYTIPSTGCFSTTIVTVASARGGHDIGVTGDQKLFRIYPNPSQGVLHLETSVNGRFSLFTIDGRLVSSYEITETTTTLSLPNDLANDVYMCRFQGEDGTTEAVRLVVIKN